MKKKTIIALVALLVVSTVIGVAIAATNCSNHHMDFSGRSSHQSTYSFWVPSCGGHPWPHTHYRDVYKDYLEFVCLSCGAEESVPWGQITYGPEICQYD